MDRTVFTEPAARVDDGHILSGVCCKWNVCCQENSTKLSLPTDKHVLQENAFSPDDFLVTVGWNTTGGVKFICKC